MEKMKNVLRRILVTIILTVIFIILLCLAGCTSSEIDKKIYNNGTHLDCGGKWQVCDYEYIDTGCFKYKYQCSKCKTQIFFKNNYIENIPRD